MSAARFMSDADYVPIIRLESNEEDTALAWARANYHVTEHARHSAEFQQFMVTLVAFVIDTEVAEQARVAQYVKNLQMVLTHSLTD